MKSKGVPWPLLGVAKPWHYNLKVVMVEDSDWRLQGQERYLQAVTLAHRSYRRCPEAPDWDHDHCAFCGAKFMVEDYPEVLHAGFCTLDEYHWICEKCFADFKDRFAWTVDSSL